MKKLLLLLGLAVFVGFIFSGCIGTGNQPGTSGSGSLVLNVSESGVNKTIEPGIDMTIAAYDIIGSGPNGANFRRDNVTPGGAVTINTLAVGNWTIEVNAKNGDGIFIAYGVTTVTVTGGATISASVTVRPINGTGILNITVSWPAGIISNPSVTGTLIPVGGTAQSISYTLAGDHLSATYQNNTIPTGYYTLITQLKDGPTLKWSAVDAVRIINGQTSIGTYELIAVQGQFGEIELIIKPDLQNPIGITFTGQQSSLPVGTDMTVTATTSEAVDSYQWYLNGAPLPGATNATLTIGRTLGVGSYLLALVVTKGNIVSSNSFGFRVGNATPTPTPSPTPTPTPMPTPTPSSIPAVIAVSAGYNHSLVLKNDGTMWAWGLNNYGQLGNESNNDSSIPVQVDSINSVIMNGIIDIAAGYYHNLALKSNGEVLAWGRNDYGQLGNTPSANILAPVSVLGMANVNAIAAGECHSLAISNGYVYAWGRNYVGELGDGTTTTRYNPVQVIGLSNIFAISAGKYHNFALKQDGTVWAWGANNYGQLGDGTKTNRSTPIQISSLTNIVAIAAGAYHSIAIDRDGGLWTWGYNAWGELLSGNNIDCSSPVFRFYFDNNAKPSGGEYHSLMMNGSKFSVSWGRNNFGQLGNGTNVDLNNDSGVVNALAGSTVANSTKGNHCLALRNDGSVWAWGFNSYGQLGNNTKIHSNIAVRVIGF